MRPRVHLYERCHCVHVKPECFKRCCPDIHKAWARALLHTLVQWWARMRCTRMNGRGTQALHPPPMCGAPGERQPLVAWWRVADAFTRLQMQFSPVVKVLGGVEPAAARERLNARAAGSGAVPQGAARSQPCRTATSSEWGWQRQRSTATVVCRRSLPPSPLPDSGTDCECLNGNQLPTDLASNSAAATRRAALAAALATLALATLAAGYAPGVCLEQCGSKRKFTDPNNLPGEVCDDSGPCGALIFPGR